MNTSDGTSEVQTPPPSEHVDHFEVWAWRNTFCFSHSLEGCLRSVRDYLLAYPEKRQDMRENIFVTCCFREKFETLYPDGWALTDEDMITAALAVEGDDEDRGHNHIPAGFIRERLFVVNDADDVRELVLEPWGDHYPVPAHAAVKIQAYGPPDGFLLVKKTPQEISVYGWPGSTLEAAMNGWMLGPKTYRRPYAPPGVGEPPC